MGVYYGELELIKGHSNLRNKESVLKKSFDEVVNLHV